jgi:hypothetical protein
MNDSEMRKLGEEDEREVRKYRTCLHLDLRTFGIASRNGTPQSNEDH